MNIAGYFQASPVENGHIAAVRNGASPLRARPT